MAPETDPNGEAEVQMAWRVLNVRGRALGIGPCENIQLHSTAVSHGGAQ